jgi:plastocyanin
MRKFAVAFLFAAVLGLAACGTGAAPGGGGGDTGAATVTMAQTSFSAGTSVTIKAGQAVTFSDPTSGGGVHNLVTGSNGQFTAATGAPTEFSAAGGMNFNPGDSKPITFATAGTYNITCTIHPSMEATITVTP